MAAVRRQRQGLTIDVIRVAVFIALLLPLVSCVELRAETEVTPEILPTSLLVPSVIDLQALGRRAKSQHLPIVLVYSASDCDHCERLEQEVLVPLLVSGDLQEVAIIVKIMIDGVDSITDFRGRQQDAEYYSIMKGVEVTPTIEFVDGDGTTLVSMIVGYQSADMYLAYFKAAAQASRLITAAQKN
ncbi:MAG: thioredoxin family protein [Thiohalomonadales bacterium]